MSRSVLGTVVHVRTGDSADDVRAAVRSAREVSDVVVAAGETGHLPPGTDDVRLIQVPDADDAAAVRRNVEPELDTAWALWLDPHEQLAGSGLALRCVLAVTAEPALRVAVAAATPWPEALGRLRLARVGAGTWTGRLHPRLLDATGSLIPCAELPAAAVTVRQPAARPQQDLERAVALATADVDAQLPGSGLTLGHAQLCAGQTAAAGVTLQRVAAESGLDGDCATDLLARIALIEGRDADAERLAARLDGPYGRWLTARAAVQLGRAAQAWELVQDIDEVAGPEGFPVPGGVLDEMRALIAFTAGRPADAVRLIESAMGMFGQIEGRGSLLQAFCAAAGTTLDPVGVVARALPEYATALRQELTTLGIAA